MKASFPKDKKRQGQRNLSWIIRNVVSQALYETAGVLNPGGLSFKFLLWQLERWLSSQGKILLFQRTGVGFLAPTSDSA